MVSLHLFNIVGVHVEENDVQSHVDDDEFMEEKEASPLLANLQHPNNQLVGSSAL